jgi:NADPH:quinone reductase-like Zn-dependent oxidoreductase
MVNRLCQNEGVQVINVVRRESQVELLKQQGATIVLNSSAADFDQQLHDACHQYQARLAFDAVAGPLTQQLLEGMPEHSKVTVYGGLSLQAARATPGQLVFEGKGIDGFWMGPWLGKKNLIQIMMMWRRAQKLLSTELKSEIRAEYPLQDAQKAVREYQSQMTGGKVLIRPAQG